MLLNNLKQQNIYNMSLVLKKNSAKLLNTKKTLKLNNYLIINNIIKVEKNNNSYNSIFLFNKNNSPKIKKILKPNNDNKYTFK
jgi:hypothetical protein